MTTWAYMAACAVLFVSIPPHAPAECPLRRELCGRSSLALVAEYLGMGRPSSHWDGLLPSSEGPFSVERLEAAARSSGLDAVSVHWRDPSQAVLDGPCVLLVKSSSAAAHPDHFVTCFGEKQGQVCLGDYPKNPALVPRERLMDFWSGTVIYLDCPGGERLSRYRWQVRRPVVVRLSAACLLALACGFAIKARRSHSAKARKDAP
ncbi:MAG: Peptidase family [Gemmataceae bacterium]|nr:Peptidase family [Gemmataceae bacterium]